MVCLSPQDTTGRKVRLGCGGGGGGVVGGAVINSPGARLGGPLLGLKGNFI